MRGLEPFRDGLYGCSEMLTLGLLDLFQSGIISRRVLAATDRQSALLTAPEMLREDEGIALHGGFFAGPDELYHRLRHLTATERARIDMTSVTRVNDLYGHEELARLQRQYARFINTAMMVNGRGAAISDTLADGRVVSGVGGQYNFSAMAHELEGARSIILLRATRQSGGETRSNIVWTGGEVTVPRHLRDIVITEYGVADLRGKTDREVAIALASIADSRFQRRSLAMRRPPARWKRISSSPIRHAATRLSGWLRPSGPSPADRCCRNSPSAVILPRLSKHCAKRWNGSPSAMQAGVREPA